MSIKSIIRESRERVDVLGNPKTTSAIVQESICLLRWLLIAVLPIKVFEIVLPFLAKAEFLSQAYLFPYSLAFASAIGAISALGIILFPRKIHYKRARTLLSFYAACFLLSSASIAGLVYFDMAAFFQFGITLLLAFAIVPLSLFSLFLLFTFTISFFLLLLMAGDGFTYILENKQIIILLPIFSSGVIGIAINSWYVLNSKRRSLAELLIQRKIKEIERQKNLNEKLLVSALSQPVVDKLKSDGEFPPEMKDATVIACDIVGFSKYCEIMPAHIVVKELIRFFAKFDACCQKYGVEPLRSQGDSRIAVAGMHKLNENNKPRCPQVDAVMAMLEFTSWLEAKDSSEALSNKVIWNARIGIHTGAVIMGVIQSSRLSFDIWGDTVNLAARLEQIAEKNKIMVSETLLWAAKGIFKHSPLRPMKSKETLIASAATILGINDMYLDENNQVNEAFWLAYESEEILLTNLQRAADKTY